MNRLVIFALVLGMGLPAMAQDGVRRADAHQHSVAAAQLAVENGRLDLNLQIPGANLVGFEHAPRDDAQRRALASARQRLEAGDWLVLPDAAGCTPRIEIDLPGFEGRGDHDRHDDGAHVHEHGDHDHRHAEFHVMVAADCARAPQWVELRLFEGWPDNRRIRLDAITETRQSRSELTAAAPRIELR